MTTAQELYEAAADERATRYPGQWRIVPWADLSTKRVAVWEAFTAMVNKQPIPAHCVAILPEEN